MSQWAPPVSLTNDGHIHSNVAASLKNGVLKTINLNGGPAKVTAGAGGGAGLAAVRAFESIETRLEPDLAIAGCRLSDPFSAPGSRVTATVTIENLGLAGSPLDDQGVSAVGIQALFVGEDGRTRVVATKTVPGLQPGQSQPIQLALEMPHDPVKVRVELFPNPIDRDRSNDVRECLFGAPSPGELRCSRIVINDEDLTPAVELSWTNAAVYDEVLVYRDGSMFASLPGGATRFVDLTPAAEETTYWVRGRMGASKSQRAACRPDDVPPEPGFRRGDADGDGEINITDAIFTLGFLFSGGREPGCHKAADADDSGQLDITDPIFTLSFLFLGGPAPPAPGHQSCGSDPTPDALPCTAQPSCN
jgi:hypothetical protein